jgi:glycosyltransferase involved in cell wall biosynthesis
MLLQERHLSPRSLRVLFALPGLHRVARGAEVAFEELGRALARMGHTVTLVGSGAARPCEPYRYIHVPCVPRERFEHWPTLPGLRSHCMYEELTFALGLMRAYRPSDYDLTITCAYPYTNWFLRARRSAGYRPRHVFVTQNGDWMVRCRQREYRHFGCDGLICTNPEFFERHRQSWRAALIPNGVDPARFFPGPGVRGALGLPEAMPLVLMVSALIPSKRVLDGIRAVAALSGVGLVVAGDGELRDPVRELAEECMPGRFWLLQLPRERMPDLYRSADVFLHLSKDESFGNVYAEALASGLSIVTHDRDVTRWILEDRAMLVNTDDTSLVSTAIRQELDQGSSADCESRRDLIHRRFAWSKLATDYAAFFRAVVARPRISSTEALSVAARMTAVEVADA